MAKHFKAPIFAGAAILLGAPAQAADIIPPKVSLTTPSGINVVDASYAYTETDLSLGPLKLERFLITGPHKARFPLIGTNMSHSFDIYVAFNYTPASPPKGFGGDGHPASIYPIIHIGAGSRGQYAQTPTQLSGVAANNQDGDRAGTLIWVGGTTFTTGHFVYTDRDGVVYTFTNAVSAAGVAYSERVAQIAFPDGRLQTFSYNSSGQLKLVNDTSGYAVVFDYDTMGETSAACAFNLSQDYVTSSSSCAGAALKVGYQYDSSKRLISVTAIDGTVTNFPGNTNNSITCIQPPGYSSCKVSIAYSWYSAGNTGNVQTLADGGVWSVSGVAPEVINDPEYTAVSDGDSIASFTDPSNKTTSFTFTKSTPRTMTDPDGHTTTYLFVGGLPYLFTGTPYHEGTMLVEADMPEGNKYLAEYNGPFFSISKETMVSKSGTDTLVKEYGYSCPGYVLSGACTKATWIKDPKGNQTDYVYATFGDLISEMLPAPSVGAARPLKLYTYVQKYAYVKNSGGSLVAAATQIWVPDTLTECQTVSGSGNGTPTCDSSAPQRVTTYEYLADGTANNLLVRGVAVRAYVGSTLTTLRTCYGYDARGRKISTTTPNAAIGVCS